MYINSLNNGHISEGNEKDNDKPNPDL